jgi:hypothetical protein
MGSDPTTHDYLTPSDDDEWSFIKRISIWMRNEKSKGIPI